MLKKNAKANKDGRPHTLPPPRIRQWLDRVIICRVKSGQIAIELRQKANWIDNVRHRVGLSQRSIGPTSPLDFAISFYRRHNRPAVQCWAIQCRQPVDQCFPTFRDLLRKLAPCRWVVSPNPPITHEQHIFHKNAYIFRLHTKLKWNRWQTIIINFNATV